MDYRNLDLEAFDYQLDGGVESFRVRVADSPAGAQKIGEAEGVEIPGDLRSRLRALERRALIADEIIALGEALAELLFPPGVRQLLNRSRDLLDENQGLRVRLRLDNIPLSDIPWEYAYIASPDTPPDQKKPDGFLALDRRISLVRYEVMGQPPGTLTPIGAGALRVVSLLANPQDPNLPELELKVEEKHIREALRDIPGVQLAVYSQATLDSLEEALVSDTHIFHFAGHGKFESGMGARFGTIEGAGSLVLLDQDGSSKLFPADRLAVNLAGRGVRLAVLGACDSGRRDQFNAWSGVAPALTEAGIPAVIGMQYTVKDSHAIAFSKRLYRALADGKPIDAAVADGRLAVFNRSSDDERDWGVPVLYLHLDPEKGQPVLFPKAAVVEVENTWEDIRERASEQAERFLSEAQGTVERPGAYIPELYVKRKEVEEQLDRFLDGEAAALVLTGDSGMGKTNVLCRWAEKLEAGGQAVFLYNCGGSLSIDIEWELAQDLSLPESDALLNALERIGQRAGDAGRQFVIVFDALNQFRGMGDAAPQHLLRRIDALVGRLPDLGVRLVIACSSATWTHFENQGVLNLFWSRYHQPAGSGTVLNLNRFTSEELQIAYQGYRDAFQLQTPLDELPASLRERIRTPLLLRMLAEVYQGRSETIVHEGLALSLFQRYYRERLRRRQDQIFVDQLAAEMYRQQRPSLAVDDLALHEDLKKEVLSEDPDSSYNRLLDLGVLTETSGDLLVGDEVRFTYPRIGAFALARHLHRQPRETGALVEELIHQINAFPLAFPSARTLLLMNMNLDLCARLVDSQQVILRELVVEALVEFHADQPEESLELIRGMLSKDSEEMRRTGLKAAYYIGSGARQIFLFAASKGSPELRRSAKDTLYLIWRHDPDFTYDLLDELAGRIGLRKLGELPNILEFLIDLSITIYINHPEQEQVVQCTDELWHEVLINRLHMDLFNTGMLGEKFENLIFQVVGRGFSSRLLDTALFTEFVPPDRFFDMPEAERERFKGIVSLVNPEAEIGPRRDDLQTLIESDLILFNILVAMVLAIHAYHDFEGTEPLLRDLWASLTPVGKLWELMAFAVLLPSTPPAWVGLLEDFTGDLLTDHRETFFGEGLDFIDQFDITMLPLGLAYGKKGLEMPLYSEGLRNALEGGDQEVVARFLEGLAPVGFYYPEAVFQTLRETLPDLGDSSLQESLIPTLATIRTLHFDAVDVFLEQVQVGENFRRRVAGAADVALVRRYIYTLGIYNNAVHQALFYPKMRRELLVGGLNALAEARSPQDFIASYTPVPIRMVREADYRLIEWTKPE